LIFCLNYMIHDNLNVSDKISINNIDSIVEIDKKSENT
jgi:hypothetical protein